MCCHPIRNRPHALRFQPGSASQRRRAAVVGRRSRRSAAWVHADEAKGREAIGVPLNNEAMAVLNC